MKEWSGNPINIQLGLFEYILLYINSNNNFNYDIRATALRPKMHSYSINIDS